MRVLFTGLTGFLGKNFLNLIPHSDWKIYALPCDKLAAEGKLADFNYHFTSEELVQSGIKDIDVLVHAGAFSPKTRLQMNDIDNNIQNITNTAYLLEHLPNIPKKIIFISSISVYSQNVQKINEESETSGDSIYGLSKLFCEKIIESFCRKNRISYQILRLGVMYGNNKGYQGLIPTFIQNILEHKPIQILNDGVTRRNFIHVKDVCAVIEQAIQQTEVCSPIVNVVGLDSISVKEIAEMLIQISGQSCEIQNVESESQMTDITFDATRLQKSFAPLKIDYVQGLKESFDFFKEYHDACL